MRKTTFTVAGTHCKACEALIEDVCREDVAGIVSCAVDFRSGKTEIEHDDSLDREDLKRQIESLGNYKVIFDLKQTNT